MFFMYRIDELSYHQPIMSIAYSALSQESAINICQSFKILSVLSWPTIFNVKLMLNFKYILVI